LEDREKCANLILFEAGYRPDAYPVMLSGRVARQRRFEENILLLHDLPSRDLIVTPEAPPES
jgi:hypothetical protein